MKNMEINSIWSLVDPLTVEQAASLIAGIDPSAFDMSSILSESQDNGLTDSHKIVLRKTAFAGLVNAINGKNLKAFLRFDAEPRYVAGIDNYMERSYWNKEEVAIVNDPSGEEYVISAEPNWEESTVTRACLIAWLEKTPIRPEIFFPSASDAPDYLDPTNSRYAYKLAAAVRAWQAVTNSGKKSPRQALEKWLRDHAAELGLLGDDGNPINQAISECSKVANWNPGGGAPKTPGG